MTRDEAKNKRHTKLSFSLSLSLSLSPHSFLLFLFSTFFLSNIKQVNLSCYTYALQGLLFFAVSFFFFLPLLLLSAAPSSPCVQEPHMHFAHTSHRTSLCVSVPGASRPLLRRMLLFISFFFFLFYFYSLFLWRRGEW